MGSLSATAVKKHAKAMTTAQTPTIFIKDSTWCNVRNHDASC